MAVFDSLHPLILFGRYALLWMGAAVLQDSASAQFRICISTLIYI